MFSENLARFQPFYDVDVGWGYLFVTALSIAALLHLFSQLLSVPVKRSPASTLQETSITKYAMENAANGTISHKSGKLPLRIAILECDTPLDKTRAKYRGYGGVFKQMLERSADALKYPGLSSKQGMEISSFNIEHYPALYPNLNDFDAVLLTGSRYDAFSSDPWVVRLVEYTREALSQNRVRVIGVCFGHQIVGRALDQRVDRGDRGWEVSVTPVELSNLGKRLFKQEALSLYQMHKDIIYGYPSTVEELGYSPICENQGMYVKNKLITIQGHPEFTKEIVEEIIESRHKLGIFTDEIFEDAMRRLKDHDDGIAVGQAFLRFLLDE